MLIPVAKVVNRLNRRLASEDRRVRKTREDSRARFDLGEFYTIDTRQNFIVDKNIDLEDWARHYGALRSCDVMETSQ
jgi:hypothetical protein